MMQPDLTPRVQRLGAGQCLPRSIYERLDSRSVNGRVADAVGVLRRLAGGGPMDSVGLSIDDRRVGLQHGAPGRQARPQANLHARICSCSASVRPLAGLSPQLWQIICFRVVEAVGGALVLANGRAIASSLYAHEGRGRALGMMSMSFHLGYITGPSVGGFLVDTVGWRWIFFMNCRSPSRRPGWPGRFCRRP